MRAQTDVIIKRKHAANIRKGYPLIENEALLAQAFSAREGSILKVYDEDKRYIGTGYYGIQNKGIGWIVSTNPNEIMADDSFFKKRFQTAFAKRKDYIEDQESTAFRLFNGEGDGI